MRFITIITIALLLTGCGSKYKVGDCLRSKSGMLTAKITKVTKDQYEAEAYVMGQGPIPARDTIKDLDASKSFDKVNCKEVGLDN